LKNPALRGGCAVVMGFNFPLDALLSGYALKIIFDRMVSCGFSLPNYYTEMGFVSQS
jgi:hypothetical protein